MDESLLKHLWVVCVFLSCKSHQTLFEQKDLQRIEASHHDINSEVIFISVNQVRVLHILGNNVTIFLVDLSFRPNYFDTFATRARGWLHDVHILVI